MEAQPAHSTTSQMGHWEISLSDVATSPVLHMKQRVATATSCQMRLVSGIARVWFIIPATRLRRAASLAVYPTRRTFPGREVSIGLTGLAA